MAGRQHGAVLDDPDDAAALAAHGATLLAAVDGALSRWVERVVAARWAEQMGTAAPDDVLAAARTAGEACRADLTGALRSLLATDVDEQRSNPLAVLRGAVPYATAVLRDAGVPPPVRDREAERLFPDDIYDLTPGAFGDVDPSLHDPGLVWGAAKAHVVLARRRDEGRR